MIIPAVLLLAAQTSTARACALLGKPRGSHYRDRRPVPVLPAQRAPRACPPNALSAAEQDRIIDVLTGPRFCDKSVAQTWATLLDEGVYLASMSTMHRLLRLIGTSGDRRNQAAHPARARPELMATRPGQVWSWDITKLRGPERGVYYDLYGQERRRDHRPRQALTQPQEGLQPATLAALHSAGCALGAFCFLVSCSARACR